MSVLATDVYVDGTRYEKGSTPPKAIAARITNPKAWAAGADDSSEGDKAPRGGRGRAPKAPVDAGAGADDSSE
jgi:hypothetical protein